MKYCIGIVILLCFVVLRLPLNAEPGVDFDGRNKELDSITTHPVLINNSADTSSIETVVPSVPEQNPILMAEFGIPSDSGEWITARSTEAKEKLFTIAFPSSSLNVDLFCRNNTQYYWSFSASFSMETWKKQVTSPGHSHTEGTPSLTYANGDPFPDPLIVKNIPPGVHHKFSLRMPIFAAQITMKMRSLTTGVCTDFDLTEIIHVKETVKLSPMPDGDNSAGYRLVPTPLNSPHPSIHNVTDDYKIALKKLGATWREKCPVSTVLRYQRMSLPWGGVFDRDLDWKEPYYGHNKGTAVDISKRDIRKGNRQGFINLLCGGFKVYSERDKDPSHYHVIPRKDGDTVNWADAVPCCYKEFGEYPSSKVCIDLAQTAELYPVASDCPDLPGYQDPNYVFR